MLHTKLRETDGELDAFSYTLSHDLKNAVTAIRGFAHLIIELSPENETVRSMADRINIRTSNLTKTIDEVFRYSRLCQIGVQKTSVNMQNLLLDIRRDLIIAMNNPNLTITVLDTPHLEGDETMLFQAFFRAETEETFEGHGVGLAIVKRIVAKHLGKIWLESEPGLGATFYVHFVQ